MIFPMSQNFQKLLFISKKNFNISHGPVIIMNDNVIPWSFSKSVNAHEVFVVRCHVDPLPCDLPLEVSPSPDSDGICQKSAGTSTPWPGTPAEGSITPSLSCPSPVQRNSERGCCVLSARLFLVFLFTIALPFSPPCLFSPSQKTGISCSRPPEPSCLRVYRSLLFMPLPVSPCPSKEVGLYLFPFPK